MNLRQTVIIAVFLLFLGLVISSRASFQTEGANLSIWQSTSPFVDSNHVSHPLPSFARGNYYYVHTMTLSAQDRILYFAQKNSDGSLSSWQTALDNHGGGGHGYTAVTVDNTPFHFRNGHIAEYLTRSDGTVEKINLKETNQRTSFIGRRYVWDTAVWANFAGSKGYVFHLGGWDMENYNYVNQDILRSAVPVGSSFQDTGVNHPAGRPGKSAYYNPGNSNYGFIYSGESGGSRLWRMKVEDNGNLGDWQEVTSLPQGDGNNLGDMFVVDNTLFAVRGKKVFRSVLGTNGELSSWDDSPPDLPEEQIDVTWTDGHLEGASYGIIGDYVYLTGAKKVFFAKIIGGGTPPTTIPNVSPTPTTGSGYPTNTPAPNNQPSPTPGGKKPIACCEIWAANKCTGGGYNSFDLFVGTLGSIAECEAYAKNPPPFSYTCNCDEHCDRGNDHDPNQQCPGSSEGKSKCSTTDPKDFKVIMVNKELCAIPTSAPTATPSCSPGSPGCPPATGYPGSPTSPPTGATNTPIPPPSATSIPPSSPAPTLPASCNCETIDIEGNVTKGQTVTITTYAKVEDPDKNNAKVLTMIYYVDRIDDNQNSKNIDRSDPIGAIFKERTTDKNGKTIDRYYTKWKWTIPVTSEETEYKVWVKINCGYKTSVTPSVIASLLNSTAKQGGSLLDSLLRFLGRLFGISGSAPSPTPALIPTPTMTLLVPTGARSLQLGTFIPATTTFLEKGCAHIRVRLK